MTALVNNAAHRSLITSVLLSGLKRLTLNPSVPHLFLGDVVRTVVSVEFADLTKEEKVLAEPDEDESSQAEGEGLEEADAEALDEESQ